MSIISDAKEIADLIKKLGDVELYRKIVELEGQIIELTQQNRLLQGQIEELEKALELKEKMRWKKPFYFMEGDSDPYCPQCWEADGLAIHLKDIGRVHAGHRWDCPKCNTMIIN